MDSFDLDLDVLVPKPKIVHLNGKAIEVLPPSMQAMIAINAAGKKLEAGDAEGLEDFLNALAVVVPALKEPGMQISMIQMQALSSFLGNMSVPPVEKSNVAVPVAGDEDASPQEDVKKN